MNMYCHLSKVVQGCETPKATMSPKRLAVWNLVNPELDGDVLVDVNDERHALGGAANVAANLRNLGAEVQVCGLVGKDRNGFVLTEMLMAQEIGTSGVIVDGSRPTINKLRVQIGEVKTGRSGDGLTAILGSCIGLGLLDDERGIYGLAHCLLSDGGKVTERIDGRHVDQAVASLVRLMEIGPAEARRMRAIVVGGANMTMPPDTDPSRLVGTINAKSAYRAVRALGIRNILEDVGGCHGR